MVMVVLLVVVVVVVMSACLMSTHLLSLHKALMVVVVPVPTCLVCPILLSLCMYCLQPINEGDDENGGGDGGDYGCGSGGCEDVCLPFVPNLLFLLRNCQR